MLPNEKVQELKNWLKTALAKVEFKGEDEDQKPLVDPFLIAIVTIIILLVTQFNSFFDALVVMSAVVMSTAGLLLGLLVMQEPLIVMGGIGIIALAGVIVSKNVIFILISIFKSEKTFAKWSCAQVFNVCAQ